MNIEQLREKASALGFSFERGMSSGAGYLLVHDASGDRPLGGDYKASLKAIDRYLDGQAADAGMDVVEIGNSEPSKPPLTMTKASKALEGHKDADKIKKVLNPPPSRREAQRDRIALDRLFFTEMDAKSAMAFDKLPEAEKEAHRKRLRAALEEEDRIKAANLPKSTIPLRTFGINSDHPFAKEDARRKMEFWKADQRWRTNFTSLKEAANDDSLEERDRRLYAEEWRHIQKKELPPEPGPDFAAPRASSTPILVHARPKLTRAEIATKKAEAIAKQQADDRQLRVDEIAAEVRGRLALRKPNIGRQLKEVRALLGAAAYQSWLRALEIPKLSARRWATEG